MRVLAGLAVVLALLPAAGNAASAPLINADGTFTDTGVWMYRTADGKFRNGDGVRGTNESLVMPSPAPQYGETLVGITHVHHRRDTMGYPVHISLIEKAFANIHKVQIFSSGSDDVIWSYEAGTPFGREHGESPGFGQTTAPPSYKMMGPMPAGGPTPPAYADAVSFLKGALAAIENLPAAQKDLSNYVVQFAETSDTVWMEIAPNPAPGETVHLGCQMQNGRDMVFAYQKVPSNGAHGGPWLQCF